MPDCAPASPAVVMVRMPSTNEISPSGIAIGSQRSGPSGTYPCGAGAVCHRPASTVSKRPQCETVGLMR